MMIKLVTAQMLRKQVFSNSLLKHLLQKHSASAAKGFTLTEMLVVIIIAAVLAGIAAPGWLAYMNRQRVGGAQTELLQMLREAQAQSIAKRTSYGIEIEGQIARRFSAKGVRLNGTAELEDDAALSYLGEEDLAATEGTELEIKTSDGDLDPDEKPRIYFNFDGSVPEDLFEDSISGDPNSPSYTISIQLPDQPASRRCIVIDTLLGSMREAKGETDCVVAN